MGAIGHDGLVVPGRVELAHEARFRLGILDVTPATRQLIGDNCSETLEPRVMQVLVALFRANGIITRDELVKRCWDGRVVGDDAINRAMSRIRAIAAGIGQGSFSVETITKVGYRLTTGGQAPGPDVEQGELATLLQQGRRKVIGALVAAGAVAAIGGSIAWRNFGNSVGPPPEAEELYERALALRDFGRQGDNRQAIAYLREAVRIAPDYGEAWGALAFGYRVALLDDPPEGNAGFEEMLDEALGQADHYDPGNADAALARRLQQSWQGRWATMEVPYRDFAARFPEHPTGHFLLGSLLMDVGRWRDAVEALRKAKARSAFSPITRYRLAVSLWSSGRISEAEREIDEALRWSTHGAVWQTKVKLLAMTGRSQAALAIVNDPSTRPADEDEEDVEDWRLFLLAMISRAPADVNRAIANLLDSVRRDVRASVPEAFQCAVLGRQNIALDILEGCYLGIGEWAPERPAEPNHLLTHPLFQPQAKSLLRHPRFERILSGIGLEQYWRATASIPDYRRI